MFQWDQVVYYLFQDRNLYFLQAAWITLWISVVAQTIGVILGLLLALMRTAKSPLLNWPAGAYIWFFRGSPLLMQVLLLWDGLPQISGIKLSAITCVLVSFSLNEGAYMSEIIRAALSSIDPGQMEASKALGMRYSLAMRRIILPQAVRVIIPPLGNEFNNMLKTTSIASVIGVMELTNTAQVYGSQDFIIFELLIVATVYYLILTTLWEFVQRWIERRVDPDRMSAAIKIPQEKSTMARVAGFGSPRSR
jgi:polar amino acid transport system permease protein